MNLPTLLALLVAFNFPHFYGIAENRLFVEHGEYLPGRHFRVYHLWLAALFAGSGFLVYVLSESLLLTACYLVYAPFGLDWVWWLIRYWDFQRDRLKAEASYGEKNAWHQRGDWDNYGGLPLVLGCYWWWWLCAALSLVLGVLGAVA